MDGGGRRRREQAVEDARSRPAKAGIQWFLYACPHKRAGQPNASLRPARHRQIKPQSIYYPALALANSGCRRNAHKGGIANPSPFSVSLPWLNE